MIMEHINIIHARQNNLKNISVQIAKKKITVFTGVSGSGKSSLVFETIGAEAQRQFSETQGSLSETGCSISAFLMSTKSTT